MIVLLEHTTGLTLQAQFVDTAGDDVGDPVPGVPGDPGDYWFDLPDTAPPWSNTNGRVRYEVVGGETVAWRSWNPARLAPDGLDGVEHPAMQYPGGHVVIDRTAGELRVYDADPATGGVLLYTRAISETATTSTIGVPT